MNAKKISQWMKDRIVRLSMNNKNLNEPINCTGTNIGDGYVLTASHCVSMYGFTEIACLDSKGKEYQGEVVRYVKDKEITIKTKLIQRTANFGMNADVGLLYFPDLLGKEAEYSEVDIFDEILIPTFIKNYLIFNKGIVVGITRNYMFTDAFVVPGTSGSPIINAQCQIVGIAAHLVYGNWSGGVTAKIINKFLAF